jgi:hypothetical protein
VQSPKVRAFVDFLVERLDFDAGFMQQAVCPGSSCSEVGKQQKQVDNAYRLALRKVAGPRAGEAEDPAVAEA